MARTQTPETDTTTPQTTKPPRRSPKKRAPRQVVLAEVTEDVNTKEAVYAILEMPPMPDNRPVRANEIRKATEKAVYEDGRREYGNKRLVALQVLDSWEVRFEERTALMPPIKS